MGNACCGVQSRADKLRKLSKQAQKTLEVELKLKKREEDRERRRERELKIIEEAKRIEEERKRHHKKLKLIDEQVEPYFTRIKWFIDTGRLEQTPHINKRQVSFDKFVNDTTKHEIYSRLVVLYPKYDGVSITLETHCRVPRYLYGNELYYCSEYDVFLSW